MSSFAWMKLLESAPARYDHGIDLLSRGRIEAVYHRIAERVAAPGRRVLDIGCGTGGASLACAARGADVIGIDINAGMLEVARAKEIPPQGHVEWVEIGVAEIQDCFAAASFDAVIACLAFSELSADEQSYALRVSCERLVPGGEIVIADETLPRHAGSRAWRRIRNLPRKALVYLLTQTTTRPVVDLVGPLRAAGFTNIDETRLWGDHFVIVYARKPGVSREVA